MENPDKIYYLRIPQNNHACIKFPRYLKNIHLRIFDFKSLTLIQGLCETKQLWFLYSNCNADISADEFDKCCRIDHAGNDDCLKYTFMDCKEPVVNLKLVLTQESKNNFINQIKFTLNYQDIRIHISCFIAFIDKPSFTSISSTQYDYYMYNGYTNPYLTINNSQEIDIQKFMYDEPKSELSSETQPNISAWPKSKINNVNLLLSDDISSPEEDEMDI